MRHTLIAFLALTFALAACAPVTPAAPTATTALTATFAPTVTATPTEAPTATEAAAPTMESLPAEWQGKIDHIETMTNMDGKTTRVVAVESLTDEDKVAGKTEAKLRVLQWNGKEWVSYVPQVGKISPAEDRWNNVTVDNLSESDLLMRMNQEKIYGKDGQEIKPGVVANFADYTLMCGDVVETYLNPKSDGNTNIDQVIAVPLVTGDIELIYASGGSPTRMGTAPTVVYDQTSVDPQTYLKDPVKWEEMQMSLALVKYPIVANNQNYWKYTQAEMGDSMNRRMLFAVQNSDLPASFVGITGTLSKGEAVNTGETRILISTVAIVSNNILSLFQ